MIFDRALRKSSAGAGRSTGGVLTLDSSEGWTGWTSEDFVALSRDKAMKLSTVSRCVELRANAMAMLPVYLMNESTKARPRDHPLGPLLWGAPNEGMSRFDYERLMQCNLDLCGNAYAWINRDGRTGRPQELIPLPPQNVTPYIDPAGTLWYVYTHPRTGGMTRLAPEDVLQHVTETMSFLTPDLVSLNISEETPGEDREKPEPEKKSPEEEAAITDGDFFNLVPVNRNWNSNKVIDEKGEKNHESNR